LIQLSLQLRYGLGLKNRREGVAALQSRLDERISEISW
jgi:hypothetical protein